MSILYSLNLEDSSYRSWRIVLSDEPPQEVIRRAKFQFGVEGKTELSQMASIYALCKGKQGKRKAFCEKAKEYFKTKYGEDLV